jgi:hypothetical protein
LKKLLASFFHILPYRHPILIKNPEANFLKPTDERTDFGSRNAIAYIKGAYYALYEIAEGKWGVGRRIQNHNKMNFTDALEELRGIDLLKEREENAIKTVDKLYSPSNIVAAAEVITKIGITKKATAKIQDKYL